MADRNLEILSRSDLISGLEHADKRNAELYDAAKEARRLIGFMTNEKIAEAARILDAVLN